MSEHDAGKTGFGGAPVALVPPSQDAGAAGTAGDALASASKHDEPAVVFVLFFFVWWLCLARLCLGGHDLPFRCHQCGAHGCATG